MKSSATTWAYNTVDELHAAHTKALQDVATLTEQRDRLAEALEWIASRYDNEKSTGELAMDVYEMSCVARAAIDSLEQP